MQIINSFSVINLSGEDTIKNVSETDHVYFKDETLNNGGYIRELESLSKNFAFYLSDYFSGGLWAIATADSTWKMNSDCELILSSCDRIDRTKETTEGFRAKEHRFAHLKLKQQVSLVTFRI